MILFSHHRTHYANHDGRLASDNLYGLLSRMPFGLPMGYFSRSRNCKRIFRGNGRSVPLFCWPRRYDTKVSGASLSIDFLKV